MEGLPGFLDRESGSLDLVTYHQYPLSVCGKRPSDRDYPTRAQLLAAPASQGLAAEARAFAAQAAARGLPFRVDEMNSVVCLGARGVSDTFAGALWLAGILLDYAAAGISGVNVQFNTRAWYSPFSLSRAGGQESALVRPAYYGLLLAARALRPGARVLPVHAAGERDAVRAWAIADGQGTVRIVAVNKSPVAAANVELRVGGGRGRASVERLTAPSLAATTGAQLGGLSYGGGASGLPSGHPTSASLAAEGDTFRLSLPAASAALLTLPAPGPSR
jgi:hypothetical protein